MLYNYHTHTQFCDGKSTVDAIIKTPTVVEINTDGMARGHVNESYHSKNIEYFKSHGKKMIFSSVCHNKDFLLCGYEEVKKIFVIRGRK